MKRTITAIAAVLSAGVLLASCSSTSDGDAAAAGDSASSAETSTANSNGTGSAKASHAPAGTVDEELEQAATRYLDAVNSGKVDAILAASCKRVADEAPADLADGQPLAQPIVVDGIANVEVTGDTATADVTASLKGAPDAPETESLKFANEDGWKVCQ